MSFSEASNSSSIGPAITGTGQSNQMQPENKYPLLRLASLNRHEAAFAKIEKAHKAYLDRHGVAPSRNKLAKLCSSSVNTVRQFLRSLDHVKFPRESDTTGHH
jgi:hypothetical protein